MDPCVAKTVHEVFSEGGLPLELIEKILTLVPPEPDIRNVEKDIIIEEKFFIYKSLNNY